LNVLTKVSAIPFDSWLRTGVKHGTRPRAAAKSSVSLAVTDPTAAALDDGTEASDHRGELRAPEF
jgi:hypothetical protein